MALSDSISLKRQELVAARAFKNREMSRHAVHNARSLLRSDARRLAGWLLLAMLGGFLAMVTRLNEVTHDAFHEMALVREWVSTGQFPRVDLFAYTDTVAPSVHHEWGTGAVLYFFTTTIGLGLFGFSVLKFLLMGCMWSMLYRVARLRGAHPYLFALFALCVFPMLWVGFATVRATLFTLVFLSTQLWMQELDRRGSRAWIIGWLCMLVLWLNMHAGFVVGVGILGLYTLERSAIVFAQTHSWRLALSKTWHLMLWPPLTCVALLINPYTTDYLPYLIKAITMPRPLIAEWAPLWFTHDPVVTMIMFALSLVLVILALRGRSWNEWMGVPGLLICSVMALEHLRHGSIYAVVWIAYVPAWLTKASIGREVVARVMQYRPWCERIARAAALACLFWALGYQAWQTTLSGDSSKQTTCYPVAAIEYLQQHRFQGNLLTPFHAGAYVSWRMHPRVKVSLDGRYEVAYAPHVFDEHWAFFEAESNWRDLLDAYPHDAVLVHQSAKVRPLLEEFRESDSLWQFVYEDPNYIILVRRDRRA